ncbi:MAG: hypothetical protein ABF449_03720 [Ethanoligenens sp.]
MGTVEWGTVAQWAGALLTGAAVIVNALQIAKSERKRREADLKHQANEVSAWIDFTRCSEVQQSTIKVCLSNTSRHPVYHVVVVLVGVDIGKPGKGENMSSRNAINALPPGTYLADIHVKQFPDRAMTSEHYGVELSFRDCNNIAWIVRSNGILEKIDTDSYVHYGIDGYKTTYSTPLQQLS